MIKPSALDAYGLEYHVVRARNRLYFRLSRKDDTGARKIFVIGHPRTGTGTIHRILLRNGVRAVHTAGNWKTAAYEGFSDRGNFQPFDLFERYYPNSVFVLNTRPLLNYLRSRMHQTLKPHRSRRVPRPRFSRANIRNEVLRRNAHFLACARHFTGRDNLVVVNIERPGALKFMSEQLGLRYEGDIWHNRRGAAMDEATAHELEAAFADLGIGDAGDNPFVIPTLLDADERDELETFLARNREHIYL